MLIINDFTILSLASSFMAYVDPGVGSYIFQIMIAGIAAIGFFFGAIKTRVKAMFGGKSDKQATNEEAEAPQSGADASGRSNP